MTPLTILTPAEVLTIRNGANMPLKDLLKYTLIDLLVKRVVVMKEIERQPNPRDHAFRQA